MSSFVTIALLVLFVLLLAGGVAAVAASLGKRHKRGKGRPSGRR